MCEIHKELILKRNMCNNTLYVLAKVARSVYSTLMGLTDEILCLALLSPLGWKEGLSVSGNCSGSVWFARVLLCMCVCIYVCLYVC